MGVKLRVLLVEDSEADAELIVLDLRRGDFEPHDRRVETAPEMRAALADETWDVILCDFNLPRFSILAALDILAESGLDLPFIVVSGMIQMEDAVSLMKAGAHDFVRKDDLVRLVPAIERELRDAALRRERGVAESALHETEKRAIEAHNRLIQSIEAISEGFALWDADDRLVLFNERQRTFFPDLADLIVPGTHFEVMTRAAAERGVVSAAIGREEEWIQERLERHKNPKGPTLNLTSRGRWLRHNEYRTPDGGSVSMRSDVTEQVRRDEDLRHSEERYRSVTQSAGEAIIVTDGHGHVISWNEGARRIFGFDEAEMIGNPLVDLIPERYREAHEAGLARLRDHGGARIVGNTVDLHGLRKSGEEFPLELSLGTWTAGEGVFVSAIIRDITERQQAEQALREGEQRLRAVMDNSPATIHLKDTEGRYLLVNRKHEEWHRTSLDDIRGQTARDIHPNEIANAYIALARISQT
jgi:phosphoserine phosphatase RsbU/P